MVFGVFMPVRFVTYRMYTVLFHKPVNAASGTWNLLSYNMIKAVQTIYRILLMELNQLAGKGLISDIPFRRFFIKPCIVSASGYL